MEAATARAPTAALVAVAAVTAAAVGVLLLPDPPGVDATLVANLVALVTAGTAAGCAGWRAVRSSGRHRHAWAALCAALTCWSVGEVLWTWLQAAGQEPFPSVADLAFLGYGPLVCAGLLLFPVGGGRLRRLQALFDGVSTGGAVLLISWETALGATLAAAGPDWRTTAVSVAYPVLDVAVTVLAVLTLARAPTGAGRRPLVLLVVGLVGVSVASSAFIYLSATTGYQPGDPLDICWNAAFGCVALAALLDRPDLHEREPETAPRQFSAGLLPYVPILGVLGVVILLQLNGRVSTLAEELAEHALVVLLVLRQYLTLRRNAELNAELSSRQRELDHQANHDVLTGLANRKKFKDRLDHALELHTRDQRPVALMFLDLDDFKIVNDTLGHTVGDQLLVRIADRLRGAVRVADTVARLGGDEFAVLLESGDDAMRCAERIREALREPFFLVSQTIRATASFGVVELAEGDTPVTGDVLLARADIAMYTAKRSGKARIRHAVPADR
jgi:diguanylate cyclase (GGDEF)-like protein